MKWLSAAAVALSICAAQPARAETALNVGLVSRTIFYLPTWIAERQGYFKAEGVNPKFEVYDGAHKIFTDLQAGTVQIGMSSIESVVQDAYKGGRLRLVAGLAQRPPHFIIAQPDIKSLADLKGRTIGVVSMHEGTTF